MNISNIVGFDWDDGNQEKNWDRHRVDYRDCEEVFFNRPLLVFPDAKHSMIESRYQALGVTDVGRRLFISFTVRRKRIRVISARNQNKKERRVYEEETP